MPPSAWSISDFSGQSGAPNSIVSSMSAGAEAQFSVMRGLAARGPQACSAAATRLLPVPVSPRISTCPSAWATSRMLSRSFSIAGLAPISRRMITAPSAISRRSARVSSVRARASAAFWHSSASRSGSNGFSTKSKAPIRIASTAIGTSPCPVIRITGRPGSTDCSRRSSAMPSMPGILMSVTTMPGKSGASDFSALSAASKRSGSNPDNCSHCATLSRMSASSSMIATLGLPLGPFIPHLHKSGRRRFVHAR